MECQTCKTPMDVIEDEPLGRLYRCSLCGRETSEFFDKSEILGNKGESDAADI